ncbi:MAG: Wadjet anti-phage system protein JetD domain-containing protein [Candidatus Heimdallarchaeaceae archaeon]
MNKEIKQFLRILKKTSNNKKKIPEEKIITVFAKVFPEIYYGSIEWNEKLLDILKELKEEKAIKLPKGKEHWNKTTQPWLPKWILLLETKQEQKSRVWKEYPWHPELSWITKLRHLTEERMKDYMRLNEYFKNNKVEEKVKLPIKERSMEIFGDEKKLDKLFSLETFVKNMTVEKLGCYRTIEPFPVKIACSTENHRAIIIENRDTFDSFWKSNESLSPAPYRYVIYGCGKVIEERILWINELDPEIREIEYFGDLDPEGVNIPRRANMRLIENRYSQRIKMALPFYLKLIEIHRKRCFLNVNDGIETINGSLFFLPKDEQKYVQYLFSQDKLISQELLNKGEILKILKHNIR